MKTPLLSFSFALALLSASACTTWHERYYLGASDQVLAAHVRDDGRRETYRLAVRSSDGEAALRVETDYERDRPFLGLRLVEIDGLVAANRGVQPYSGLLVQGVYPGSAAATAGVLAGDVLRSLDDRTMAYLVQLADFEAALADRQAVRATVLRGQTELDVRLVATTTRQSEHDVQDVALEVPPRTDRPVAGAALRGIPAVWYERMFGEAHDAVVVTSVEVGSPAWCAGVRGGDLVDAVDGAPPPDVGELVRRLRDLAEAGASTTWRVRRAGGDAHDATIELADYSGETHVWIPFVFGLDDGVHRDRWAVGPFGLLLSNKNHYVADPNTRAAPTRNVFNAILGLFHVDTSPERTQIRLFWIVDFEV